MTSNKYIMPGQNGANPPISRGMAGGAVGPMAIGPFTVDLSTARVYRDGRELQLRPQVFRVLRFLIRNSGRLVDYEEMLQAAWGGARRVSKHTVAVTLRELKDALGEYASWITIRPGYGYSLEIPESEHLMRVDHHFAVANRESESHPLGLVSVVAEEPMPLGSVTNMSANADRNMPKSGIRSVVSPREFRSSPQTERAAIALREMLVQGRLRPGEKIREVPLSAELNISRIPLHLALERLAGEGFLEMLPKRGFRVQRFSVEDIYDAIDLRGVLEGAAARIAAERLKDTPSLAPMQKLSQEILNLVRRSGMTIDTFTQYIELNSRFHSGLLELAGSRMLRRAIERACCLPFASPSAFLNRQYISTELRELFLISADQHCGIVDAIGKREGMRAEAIAREHARVARRNFEDALKHREGIDGVAGAKLKL